jgi:hypothetical protein
MHQEFESHLCPRRVFDGSNNILVWYADFATLSGTSFNSSKKVVHRIFRLSWSVGESLGCITLWIDCCNRITWCVLDYGWNRQETSSIQTYDDDAWSAFNVLKGPVTTIEMRGEAPHLERLTSVVGKRKEIS